MRLPTDNAMFERNVEIVTNRKVADATYLMELYSPETASEARPGQFVMLRVRDGMDPLLRRPFSLCGVRDGEYLSILYRTVGTGTHLMTTLEVSSRVWVLGPLGRGFDRPPEGRVPLLVAGGIGLAPLLFLGRGLAVSGTTVLAGYRSAGEVIPVDQVGPGHPPVTVATDDGTRGYHGFVTDLLEARLAESGAQSLVVYACGPKAMLRKVAAATLGLGLPCRVSLEAFMACGLGACQGCAVRAAGGSSRTYYHVCQDGPVFPVEAVEWERL